jgi:hypothetical protein
MADLLGRNVELDDLDVPARRLESAAASNVATLEKCHPRSERSYRGFPNGEAQKAGFPMPVLNIARVFVRQTFGFGGEQETMEDGPNQLAGKQDISRIASCQLSHRG